MTGCRVVVIGVLAGAAMALPVAVNSPGDRQTAGSIVNGTFGVLSVENNLFVTAR